MLEVIQKNKFFFLTAGVVLFLIIFLLFFLNRSANSYIQLSRVSPVNNQDRVSPTSSIRLTFSRLPNQNPEFTIRPTITGSITRDTTRQTITFTPEAPLEELTEYVVTVSLDNIPFVTPESTVNSSYTWSFTTDRGNYGESFLETDPTAAQEFGENLKRAENAFTERKRRLPFIIHLPYETDHYKIEISALSDTVTITTFGDSAQTHRAYREEALDWIRDNGGNTQNFTLQYVPASL